MVDTTTNHRLPKNFHKTFIPERRYLKALLQFASAGKKGDARAIADATGIPTGASSGKVMPTIDYCRGMGLITLSDDSLNNAVKTPNLTHFGRVVLLEDPFLKEPVTQWAAHLNLCGAARGADIWYQVFFQGAQALGSKFGKDQLETYLQSTNGSQANLIGPLIRMYDDPASFSECGALTEKQGMVRRKTGPIGGEYAWGYGAWMLDAMETYFPGQNQVTLTDLDRAAGWKTIPGWNIDDAQQALSLIEQKGIFTVERHMTPWIIQSADSSSNVWKKIYDDLI
ncbi:DUF4007 family protein [uncultured Desulfobacter sp.]|uniref:DUF4007 family protein n=1 Tax=uncultured Desulfobacter sp. TaxID=240139 RepID=UPI002AAC4D56|nr:DUF4007 family protein [uncultured Desulfobacter sp.]